MATRNPDVLIAGTYVGNTDTTLATAPAQTRYTVTAAYAYNADTSAVENIKIHRVESGGSVSEEKVLQPATGIAPTESIPLDFLIGSVLNPGDFFSGIASTASKVSVQIFMSRYIS